MSGRAKSARRASASAGPSSAVPPSGKRAKGGQGALAEGALSGEAAVKEMAAEEKKRRFWERFQLPLLVAWLSDYSDHGLSAAQLGDRDTVITKLVTAGAALPPGKQDAGKLKTLQNLWRKQNPGAGEAPGYEGDLIDGGEQPSDADDVDMTADAEVQVVQAPQFTPARAPQHTGVAQRLVFSQHASPPPSSSPQVTSTQGHAAPVQCQSCLVANSSGKAMWVCECGRRGDLPPEHPLNIQIGAKQIAEIAARPGPSAPSSAASSSSQTHTDSTRNSADTSLPALERRYTALATDLGFPFIAAFTGPDAGAPLAHTDALEISREALAATSSSRPTTALVSLIRAGRLTTIGHAIPRALEGISVDAEGLGVAAGANGQVTITAASGNKPPPANCDSLQSFCRAMFSTILPALIDRPKAIMQWLTLGRTALHLESVYGWPVAAEYVAQNLVDRVQTGQAFGPVNTTVLQTVTMNAPVLARGQRPPSVAPTLSNINATCNDYNSGSCTRPRCSFAHTCRRCPGKQHAQSDPQCPQHMPPRDPRWVRPPAPGSGGGTRRGGSVATAHSSAASRGKDSDHKPTPQ